MAEEEKELYKDKIAASHLQQVREIIMRDSSWSDDAKTITDESFNRAINALMHYHKNLRLDKDNR